MNLDELGKFIAASVDPTSRKFRQFMTPQQFAARYGQPVAVVDRVRTYLQSQGMTVTQVYNNNLLLMVKATNAQASAVFGTAIHTFNQNGVLSQRPLATPAIPAAIQDDVASVAGLGTKPRARSHLKSAFQRRLQAVLTGTALALTAALATPAHADVTKYVALVQGAGSTTQTATFSDVVGAIGSFTDDFIFSSPPPVASATFSGTAGAGITFSSVTLMTYGSVTVDPISGSFSTTAFNESANPALQSAVYVLEIKDVSQSLTASYSGTITAAPVPEPATWATMLLGLGLTGLSLQRCRRT